MNRLFFKDKPIIGLDISQTGIKVMALDPSHWSVLGYGSADLDPVKIQKSLDENDDYLSNNLKALLKEKIIGKVNSDHVVLSIPTSKTYARTFSLPSSAESNLKEAIELEVDQYIPVPMAQLYIDYEIIKREKDKITILLCAVPKTIVDACVNATSKAGLSVVMVEPSVSAIARLLTFTEDGSLPTAIVDIGPATTDIAILDESIRVTGSVAIGGNTFTLEIAKKLKVPLENAHQLKVLHGLSVGNNQTKLVSALEPSLRRIIAETKKVIRYYNERLENSRKLEQLLVVGSGSGVPGIGDYFTNAMVMPARVASPWQILNFGDLKQPAKQIKPRFITVAGLASVKPKEIW